MTSSYGRSPADTYGPSPANDYESLSKETKIVDEWLAKDMGYMVFLGMWSRDYGMNAAVQQMQKKLLEDKVLTEAELRNVDMSFFTNGCIREAQMLLSKWGV